MYTYDGACRKFNGSPDLPVWKLAHVVVQLELLGSVCGGYVEFEKN